MGWDCWNRGTVCPCNSKWQKCTPQLGTTCTNHRCNVRTGGTISSPRSKTSWTDEPVTTETVIKMTHLNELRNALNNELSVRRLSSKTWTNPGVAFSSTQWIQIRDAINECRTYDKTTRYYDHSTSNQVTAVNTDFSYSNTYEVGKTISTNGTQQLRQFVNILQGTCICDCNYDCSCNCNYCTCHCNYCVCNSQWSCTCYCAYSDKRLKENIEDLDEFCSSES